MAEKTREFLMIRLQSKRGEKSNRKQALGDRSRAENSGLFLTPLAKRTEPTPTKTPTAPTASQRRPALGASRANKGPNPELSNGHLIALDSDAAQNAAWARRAEMISYLPRSARVEGGGEAASRVRRVKLRPRTVIPSCCHMIEYAYIVWTYSIHMIAYLRARAPERRSER